MEETISLSKSLNQRTIQIKPLKQIEEQDSNVDLEEVNVEAQVTEARNQLEAIKSQQKSLIEQTELEITNKREEWEETKQNLIDEAHREGYEAGFTEGKNESLLQFEKLIDHGNEVVQLAEKDYQQILDKNEDTIIDLAIQTAEKILQLKIADEPKIFSNIVIGAIKEIKEQSMITIQLSSANYEEVLQQKEELQQLLQADTKLTLQVKSELQENECVIEHPFGKVDASIKVQLNEIHSTLMELNAELKQ